MAKRQVTTLVDDITGDEISADEGESLTFAVNGVEYQIDLNAKNAKKFHDTMAFYIDHATRTGGRRRSAAGAGQGGAPRGYDAKAVRTWAQAHDVQLPSRGRIPATVLERYRAEGN